MTVPTVFIVEDDPDTREMLGKFLELEGFHVETAANGRQALDRLSSGLKASVIVLDLMMPIMDGWQFREEQRKIPAVASIPVVTVTADGDARGKAASIQAVGYIAKPISIDTLLDEVERICGLAEA